MTVPTLKLKVRKKAVVKGRALVRFPANVETLAFLTVARANGVYTFGADFKRLDEAHVSDPTAVIVALFDLNTGGFKQATLASLMPIASQSEAQTGSDNTKTMTPLRVKQSIASEVGVSIASKSQGDLADSALQVDDIGDSVQGYDANLADIAGLSPDDNDLLQRKSGAWTNRTPAQVKTDLVLNNVDNTSDANKPVSTATQTALDAKANTSDLATVATSGSYDDLTDQPTIPAAGLPTGGATGQVLAKSSGTDYAVNWSDAGAGDLISTNNLSDVADAQTSAMNLGLYDFDTKANAEAATIPSVRACLRIGGYAAVGDGGGALYARVGSEPSHDGKIQSADGAWWELSADPVDIRMFGASTAGSGTDNAAAINSACVYSQNVVAPAGTFDVGANINTKAFRTIRGAGRFETIFNKTFDGDMVTLGSGANLFDIALIGNGATYTGRGVTIDTGTGAQWISRTRIQDFNDYCVEYTAASAGTQGGIGEGCLFTRTADHDICIKYPDDAFVAAPRYLLGGLTGGAYTLCDTNGAQNLFIIGGYCNNIVFGSNTGKVLVWGTRIALVGASMTVKGSDLIMDGCAIAGDVDWQAGAGSSFGDQNILSGTFTDSTNSGQACKLYFIGTSFTPSWRADTTNPAIGNGTLAGQIAGHGKFRRYTVQIAAGSTTTFGSGPWYIPLKGSNEVAKTAAIGTVYGFDNGTAFRVGACYIAAGDNKIRFVSDGGVNVWGPTVPQTWASGDYFRFCIDIELS